MTTLIAGLAAGWALYRLIARITRRRAARRAEHAARPTDHLETLYQQPAATRRNTQPRKENQ